MQLQVALKQIVIALAVLLCPTKWLLGRCCRHYEVASLLKPAHILKLDTASYAQIYFCQRKITPTPQQAIYFYRTIFFFAIHLLISSPQTLPHCSKDLPNSLPQKRSSTVPPSRCALVWMVVRQNF